MSYAATGFKWLHKDESLSPRDAFLMDLSWSLAQLISTAHYVINVVRIEWSTTLDTIREWCQGTSEIIKKVLERSAGEVGGSCCRNILNVFEDISLSLSLAL